MKSLAEIIEQRRRERQHGVELVPLGHPMHRAGETIEFTSVRLNDVEIGRLQVRTGRGGKRVLTIGESKTIAGENIAWLIQQRQRQSPDASWLQSSFGRAPRRRQLR